MFKNSFMAPAGRWGFAFKDAALEMRCLSEDITVSDLCRIAGVSRLTMTNFLTTGAENKAAKALRKKGYIK